MNSKPTMELLYYNFAVGNFHTKELCNRLYLTEMKCHSKAKKSLFEPPFWGLKGNVRTPSTARWKACGRLPTVFVIIELFSLPVMFEMLQAEICRSRCFSKGWVTLSANFRLKGPSPTNNCLCQQTRVIALSCGIKISAVHCLVLPQSMCVTDRWRDGRTDRQMDGKDRIMTPKTALA